MPYLAEFTAFIRRRLLRRRQRSPPRAETPLPLPVSVPDVTTADPAPRNASVVHGTDKSLPGSVACNQLVLSVTAPDTMSDNPGVNPPAASAPAAAVPSFTIQRARFRSGWGVYMRGGRRLTHIETIIEDPRHARSSALRAVKSDDVIDGQRHLVYITDGSHGGKNTQRPNSGGYSVVSKIPGTKGFGWLGQPFAMESCFDAQQAELSSQAEAMGMAVEYVETNDLYDVVVQIFNDSTSSIKTIRRGIKTPTDHATGGDDSFVREIVQPILERLAICSERLKQRRCRVEIRWLKRACISKHILADELAGDARLDKETICAVRGPATRNLDLEVEEALEAWKRKKEERARGRALWDHQSFTADLVARVIQLRRLKKGPGAFTFEMELEMRKIENLVGWRVDEAWL